MRKSLLIILIVGALFSCGKSSISNQYIGTWRNNHYTEQILTITHNEGGTGYSVTRAIPPRVIEAYPATLDGNVLIVNQQITSTVLHLQDNKLFAKLIVGCDEESCTLWTKVK